MSRRTRTTLALLAGGALALSPVLAGSVEAAGTQVGQSFPFNGQACSIAAGGYTILQTAGGGASYTFPTAGVVTAWKTQPSGAEAAGTQVALKVGRPDGGGYSIVGTSDPATVAGPVLQGAARIPVQAGDVVGGFFSAAGNCARAGGATDTVAIYAGSKPVGPAGSPAATQGGVQLNMEATLEPDADGDGFGDVSQDLCPTKATTQKECVPPVTSVSSAAKKAKRKANGKYKKATVTVSFATSEPSTSTCSVDGAAARACTSPFTFKAKKGTHTVSVVSTDANGNVAAAVTTSVKVKKAKAKKK